MAGAGTWEARPRGSGSPGARAGGPGVSGPLCSPLSVGVMPLSRGRGALWPVSMLPGQALRRTSCGYVGKEMLSDPAWTPGLGLLPHTSSEAQACSFPARWFPANENLGLLTLEVGLCGPPCPAGSVPVGRRGRSGRGRGAGESSEPSQGPTLRPPETPQGPRGRWGTPVGGTDQPGWPS